MKRRIRPIHHLRHKPVPDRIDMDVIHVTREIIVIANGMLPIASLPDTAFALGGTALGNPFAGHETPRKCRFDQPPARGKVCVVLGQGPDRVQMIRQHNHRIDRERVMPAYLTKRGAQLFDVIRQQLQAPPPPN